MRAADSTQETPLTYAQGSMRTLLWTTSATRGDVAGLRQLLAYQVGGSGDDPCMHALTKALSPHRLAGVVTILACPRSPRRSHLPQVGERRIEHASRQAETSESGGRGRLSSQVAPARLSEEFVVVHPKTVAVRVADGH
jgi:hypothetical protein